MNGISEMKPTRKAKWLGLTGLLLAGCLQGPWDYTPQNPPLFLGLWAQAYVIADRPVTDVCFERLKPLDEKSTPAFAFYDSAEVGIEGRFSDGGKTMQLRAKALRPNCFVGDTASRGVKGETYTLRARIVWDSAGVQVVSNLTATATITDSFAVKKTAMAPSVAFLGGFGSNGTAFSLENYLKLPAPIREQINSEFPSEIRTLTELALSGDSVGQRLFFFGDGKSKETPPGARMIGRLMQLLENDQKSYAEGDTLFYISNADLNTLSHTFTTLRGRGVKAVMISQRWETTASRVVNPFQTFFGQKPDSASFYFPGDVHRLEVFPDGMNVAKGFNFLDSIGVVNTWFFTGRNRLYFYACDTNYATYLNTNTQAGDSPEDNPKITAYSNVRGGRGFLAALAVDSFDVFIKADTSTDKPYALTETHANSCRKEGWFSDLDCIDYYRPWCSGKKWQPSTCVLDAVRACQEVGGSDTALDSVCLRTAKRFQADSSTASACKSPNRSSELTDSICAVKNSDWRNDTNSYRDGLRHFCIEHNYPDSVLACAKVKIECESTQGTNACKEMLWQTCDLRDWQLPACRNGQVTYCRDQKPNAPTLCKAAAKLCTENPKPSACL